MARFNVVKVDPSGRHSTRGSEDVARLLFLSFQSLGHETTLETNRFDGAAVNIVVGYERLPEGAIRAGTVYVPYQLEQIAGEGRPPEPGALDVLRRASQVWDYDPRNIAALKELGIEKVRHLPIGFHEKLFTIAPQEPDVDVLFYGLMNERRQKVLEAIAEHFSVRHAMHVYGAERDLWIARSKVVINIHYYEARIAEQVRVSYLLNNRRCVVSEASAWDPLADLCVTSPYEGLPRICVELLSDGRRWEAVAASGFEGFAKRPMTGYLQRVLEGA